MSLDLEQFRQALRDELEARARIDAEVHADHHAFIAELIDDKRRRRDLFDRVRQQVIGWAVIASLGAFAAMIAREIGRLFHRSQGG